MWSSDWLILFKKLVEVFQEKFNLFPNFLKNRLKNSEKLR